MSLQFTCMTKGSHTTSSKPWASSHGCITMDAYWGSRFYYSSKSIISKGMQYLFGPHDFCLGSPFVWALKETRQFYTFWQRTPKLIKIHADPKLTVANPKNCNFDQNHPKLECVKLVFDSIVNQKGKNRSFWYRSQPWCGLVITGLIFHPHEQKIPKSLQGSFFFDSRSKTYTAFYLWLSKSEVILAKAIVIAITLQDAS